MLVSIRYYLQLGFYDFFALFFLHYQFLEEHHATGTSCNFASFAITIQVLVNGVENPKVLVLGGVRFGVIITSFPLRTFFDLNVGRGGVSGYFFSIPRREVMLFRSNQYVQVCVLFYENVCALKSNGFLFSDIMNLNMIMVIWGVILREWKAHS